MPCYCMDICYARMYARSNDMHACCFRTVFAIGLMFVVNVMFMMSALQLVSLLAAYIVLVITWLALSSQPVVENDATMYRGQLRYTT